jgi:PilZ domain-containing protein
MFETISTWPMELQIGLATGAGVFAAGVMYLALRGYYAKAAATADLDYLLEHSILPDTLERSRDDSDPFSQGSETERRKAPRRRGNPVAILLADEEPDSEPVEGYVIDRSLGGLGVELDDPVNVEPGMVLTVRPRRGAEHTAWTRVVVRSYEKLGANHRLGCQFTRPPNSQTMLHFG